MKTEPKPVTLITGGSKGIGLAIAQEFARHGHDLLLVARHTEDLQQAARQIQQNSDVEVHTIALDLSKTGAAETLFEQVQQKHWQVDILVNNAGIGMVGKFATAEYSDLTTMLRLNVLALSQLTHLFVQPMLQRGKGRILNIASVAAYFAAAPNWAVYVASKHYVLSLSKGLARDLKGSGVTATVVSPGPAMTDFVSQAGAGNMRAYQLRVHQSVEQIARVAYRACIKGKVAAIPGVMNKVLAFLGELHPRRIAFEVFALLSGDVPESKV